MRFWNTAYKELKLVVKKTSLFMEFDWIDEAILAAGRLPLSEQHLKVLQKQGIKAIITLTENPLTVQMSLPEQAFTDMGFELFHVAIDDHTPPTRQQALDVFNYLQAMQVQGKPIYIHCRAGIGRTGTLLHAIELHRGASLDSAKAKILLKRAKSQYGSLTPKQQRFLEALSNDLA